MFKYREGLLPFALLAVTGVVAVAILVDPKGFSIREWQTLLAAFVALGAATLAYRATMAKVDLDRSIHRETQQRHDLGICLRLEYTLAKLYSAAQLLEARIPAGRIADRTKVVQPSELALPEPDGIVEAWDHLEALPDGVATTIADIRHWLSEIASYQIVLGDKPITVHSGVGVPSDLLGLRQTACNLSALCDRAKTALGVVVKQLRQQ